MFRKHRHCRTVMATFIGEDGSLGYRWGKMYNLHVKPWKDRGVLIHRPDGSQPCPYDSIGAWERDWVPERR